MACYLILRYVALALSSGSKVIVSTQIRSNGVVFSGLVFHNR
jgi:hypothetical protein